MKLDASTSQQELRVLLRRVSRDNFLRDTPLNLRLFARYAALFILFPGMVLGFRVGLAIMLLLCVGMLTALLNDAPEVAERLALSWLFLGVAVLLWVSGHTTLSARNRLRLQRQLRPADAPLPPDPLPSCDTPFPLKWRKDKATTGYESTLVLHNKRDGIWVVLLDLDRCGRGHLLAPPGPGICCPHSSGKSDKLQVLALCHLAPGSHHLTWHFLSHQPHPPSAVARVVCKT